VYKTVQQLNNMLQVNESLQKGKHNSYSLDSQFLFINIFFPLDEAIKGRGLGILRQVF